MFCSASERARDEGDNLAAVPEFGRSASPPPPEAELTRDLFARFRGHVYGYCLHQLGSREEAEDAMQTTFLNAFRGLQRGVVPRVEGAWLFKIAQNVCRSRLRSSRRRGRIETPTNFDVLQDVAPARERTSDELIRMHEVLAQLPATQRRAILMREWRGLSYREIAAELRLSQAAVEALIFRARRALAAGLAESVSQTARKRRRYGVDAGALLAAVKSLFGGGTAVKVAVTVAAVATTAVASDHVSHRQRRSVQGATPPHMVAPTVDGARVGPARPPAQRQLLQAPARPVARARVPRRRVVHPSAPAATTSSRVFAPQTDGVTKTVAQPPVPATATPKQLRAAPTSPEPIAALQVADSSPSPPSTNPGRWDVKQNTDAVAPVAPSTNEKPAAAVPPASRADDEHGVATAPGQQNKPDRPGKSKEKGD